MGVEPLIHARGLVKRFGKFTAVDGIDVDVAPGEAFGFLGPNGAGKSSTMRMIGCVSAPSAGTLRILGLDPVRDGPAIRGRRGVCPQQDCLDPELSGSGRRARPLPRDDRALVGRPVDGRP